MQPRVYKNDFVPGLSRRDLHEMAVAYAVVEFERRGRVPSMWLIVAGAEVTWIETPWEDDREKEWSTRALRGVMREMGARAYSFITEAWVASYRTDIDDPEILPSERPENERDEVLVIMTYDLTSEFEATRFLVTPRKNGNNLLGPRDDETFKEFTLEGRMFNLLVR